MHEFLPNFFRPIKIPAQLSPASMSSKRPAYILGVGISGFTKPQASNDYTQMGFEAGVKALLDADIKYDDVERAVACYCYGDSTCGQRVLYQFGMTAIPIYNVNNNCAIGSTGLVMAKDLISGGLCDCVLVVGFEKMSPGSLSSNFNDRTNPLDRALEMSNKISTDNVKAPFAARMFGNAAEEYNRLYGSSAQDFAQIAQTNHEHSQRNPYSQFHDVYTLAEVESSRKIYGPLTKLQCCPTSDGAAAAVIVSDDFLKGRLHLRGQSIKISGQSLATDDPSLYDGSACNLVGRSLAANTARQALNEAKLRIEDVKVIELHDCFSTNEIMVIDALGLSAPGKAHEYIRRGDHTYGTRKAVINPSGGLISKGHPLGATGIAQCAELVWHLRGWANNRFVAVGPGKAALQQNAGLGGACVVTVLQRADGESNEAVSSEAVAATSRLGYNPAVEARGITQKDVAQVVSKRRNLWALGPDASQAALPARL